MKNLIMLIALILVSKVIFSQDYFQTSFGDINKGENPSKIIQTENNDFILCGSQQNLDSSGKYLVKFSETGEILKTIITYHTDTASGYTDMLKLENNNLLILGGLKANSSEIPILEFTEINDELEIIKNKKIQFPIDTIPVHYIHIAKGIDNEYLCYGQCFKDKTSLSFIFRLTSDFELIYLYTSTNEPFWDIFVSNNKKIFNIRNTPQTFITIYDYYTFACDTAYNFTYNTNLLGSVYIEPINNNEFTILNVNSDYQLNTFNFDYNINILNHYDCIIDTDMSFQDFQFNSLDINKDKEIFSGAQMPLHSDFHNFVILKTDSMLNPIWEKFYEIESQVFWLFLQATKDGGFILVGNDSPFDYYNSSIIVIKSDSLGNITHINGIPNINKGNEILLYPNPATDFVNIRLGLHLKDVTLGVYDISGKNVLTQNLQNIETQINISEFKTGTYIYKCFDNERIIDKGRFIKEYRVGKGESHP